MLSLSEVSLDKIIAVVNNEIILESDFKQLQSRLKNSSLLDDSLIELTDIASLEKDKKVQLEYLINERIIDSEVKRLNMSVTMEKVQQEIKEMGKRNNMSADDVLSAVKSQGIKVSDYQDFLKTRIERQGLLEQEIISKIRITEEEAYSEYLKRNPKAKAITYEFKIAHILFRIKKDGTESALSRAQSVINKLNQGEKFEALAEQNSEDPNFSNGGILGTFKSGEFSKEMEESIKDLEPGANTAVVKTKQGFHIFKLLEKKTIKDPAFEKQKGLITSQLVEKNFKRQLRIWIQAKKDESFIKIN